MLASQRDLGEILREILLREGVHFDLARPADGYPHAPHGLGLDALHRQGDKLKAKDFHALWIETTVLCGRGDVEGIFCLGQSHD